MIDTARANPLDKFELGVRKLIEDLMVQRMADNDAIVTRYMGDAQFQATAFPILAKAIFESINRPDPIEAKTESRPSRA